MTAREKLFTYNKIYDQHGTENLFIEAMKESVKHHSANCEFYNKLLVSKSFNVESIQSIEDCSQIPFVTAQFFKHHEVLSIKREEIEVHATSSGNKEVIEKLIEICNAVVVWGSDIAIKGLRQLVPPSMPLIEWGHRLSFAYFTRSGNLKKALEGLARDTCLTDQLYCTAPQCVFYEASSREELDSFAYSLSKHLEQACLQYPSTERPFEVQAQITWSHELVQTEEILGEKKLITDKDRHFGVMMDYKPGLRSSPLFRNVWVMPIERQGLFEILSAHKGYLQTVGISCKGEELDELSDILYSAGVVRVTSCGYMSESYVGEPHDGIYSLTRYVRRVSRRIARGQV